MSKAWAQVCVEDEKNVKKGSYAFDFHPESETPQEAFAKLMTKNGYDAKVVSPVEVEVDGCVYIVDTED